MPTRVLCDGGGNVISHRGETLDVRRRAEEEADANVGVGTEAVADDDDGGAANRHHTPVEASRPPSSSEQASSPPSPLRGSGGGGGGGGVVSAKGTSDAPPHPPPLPPSSSSSSFSIAEALREHRRRTRCAPPPTDAGVGHHPSPPAHRRPIDVVAVILSVSNLDLVGGGGGGGGGGGAVSLLIGDQSLPPGECARIALRGGEATAAVLGGTMNVGDVFRFNRLTVRRDYDHDLPHDEGGGGTRATTVPAPARLHTPRVRPRQTPRASGCAEEESLDAPGESAAKKEEGGGEGGRAWSNLTTPTAAAVAGRLAGRGTGSGAKRLRVTPSPAVAAAARKWPGGDEDATAASTRRRVRPPGNEPQPQPQSQRRRGWGRRQLPDVVCEFGHSWLDPEAGPSFARLGYFSPVGAMTLTPLTCAAAASSAPSSSPPEEEEEEEDDPQHELDSSTGGGAAVVLADPDEVPIGMAAPSRLIRGLLDWYHHRRDHRVESNRERCGVSPGALLQQPQQPPRSIVAAATCGIIGGVNIRSQSRRRRRLRDAVSSPNLLSDVVVRVDAFHHDGEGGASASLRRRHHHHRGRPNASGASYAAISDGPKEEDQSVLVVATAVVGDKGHAGRGGGGVLASALEGAAHDGESSLVLISAVLSRRACLASAVGLAGGGAGNDLVLVPTSKTAVIRYKDGEGAGAASTTTSTMMLQPQPWTTHTPSLTMERAAAPTAFVDSCPTPLGWAPSVVVLERREVRSRLVNVFINDVGSSLVGGWGEQAITPDNLVRHILESGTAAPLATDASQTTTTGTDGEEQRRFLARPRYRGATLALDAAVLADCCFVKADGAIVETLCGSVSPIELMEETERRLDDVDGRLLSEQVYHVLFGMISEEISLHWTIEKRRNDAVGGGGNGWHVIDASLKRL